MKSLTLPATAMLVTLSVPAAGHAATGDDWTNQPVRIEFGAEGTVPVGGKVMRTQGCLYVRLDAPRDGLTLIRLDQVRQLQVRSGSGWATKDVAAVLAREPAHCREEANG